MTDFAHEAQRRALTEIVSRRSALGATLLGVTGLLAYLQGTDAKKRKKGKKRCKNGAKRCGKGCCKSPSVCSAASCFCTGNEGNCTSIPQELIKVIAEGLGVPADQIGANPDQPLAQCQTIVPPKLDEINGIIEKEFGVTGPVNWCQGGINAGVKDIILEITTKA